VRYFPDRLFPDAGAYAAEYFGRLAAAAATIDFGAVSAAGALLRETVLEGKRIYSCGNGGSAAIANHLVCDCLKSIRNGTSMRPKVHSFSTTIELITAIVNDIGSEEMFAYQLESMGEAGDLLIAISSSGSSPNIVKAIERAKEMKIRTIAMTGFTGGPSREIADVNLHVDCSNYGMIEDLHQSLMHVIAQYVRHEEIYDLGSIGNLKF
jgi:phosphoheptose isomerase